MAPDGGGEPRDRPPDPGLPPDANGPHALDVPPEADGPPSVGLFHRVFDRFYPAIRFTYERGMGHVWFSEVTPQLWLGGAPTYGRDFEEILALGITGVVDMRAEREADAAFFAEHDIALRQYFVPDVTVPDEEVLTDAVAAITAWVGEGRTVLIHCAKGRGRSATVLAAYLMKTEGMSFDQVSEFLTQKRALVKLQDRHRVVLESWIAKQEPASGP
jgi:protein tyrosine phosphatase (PTP) superfamily phosphohydrolase (DUF442 family)